MTRIVLMILASGGFTLSLVNLLFKWRSLGNWGLLLVSVAVLLLVF